MIKSRVIFVFALVLVGAIQIQGAIWSKTVTFLDDKSDEDLARAVCQTEHSDKQLKKVSSINRLNNYFSELPNGHELEPCAAKYRHVLHDLYEVVTVGNPVICSKEKVDVITEFHKKYISTLSADEASNADEEPNSPKILKNFFKHYALEISYICKRTFVKDLDYVTFYHFGIDLTQDDFSFKFGPEFMGEIGKSLGNFFHTPHHFDDLILLWDLAKKKNDKYSMNKVDEETGEEVRMYFIAQNTSNLLRVQEQCRKRFKPVYSKTILPIVQLANIGYSYTDSEIEKLEGEMKKRKLIKEWYKITQFCEIMIPCRFYEDSKIADKRGVIVTESEAMVYKSNPQPQLPEIKPIKYEPFYGLTRDLDELSKINTAIELGLASKIDGSQSSRKRNLKKIIVHCFRAVRQNIYKYSGKFLISKKARNLLDDSGALNTGKLESNVNPDDVATIVTDNVIDQKLSEVENNNLPEVAKVREKMPGFVKFMLSFMAGFIIFLILMPILAPSAG